MITVDRPSLVQASRFAGRNWVWLTRKSVRSRFPLTYPSSFFRIHPVAAAVAPPPPPAKRGQGHVILGLVPRVSSFTPHRRDNLIVQVRESCYRTTINRSVRPNSRLRRDEINTRSRVHPSTNKSMRVLALVHILRDTTVIRMFENFHLSLSLSLLSLAIE